MLVARPIKFRKRPPKIRPAPQQPLASGPVLVSATFGGSAEPTLVLTFDRAIDVSGYSPSDLIVDEGATGIEWGGTGVFEAGAQSLTVTMIENGEASGPGVSLTATNGAGIVASDGGAAWAGVTDLELPFP